MARWRSRFVSTVVITMGLTLAPSPGRIAHAAPPPKGVAPVSPVAPVTPAAAPAPAPAPSPDPMDDPWEERKLRAREDVDYLDALYKAKQVECREAELRNNHALALKTDIDRQKQKGYASTFTIHQAEMSVAENQSQLEMRRVELKDVEIRLARSRRRLRAVEHSAAAYEPESFPADDRLRELEVKYERLRREFERVKRLADIQTTRP